MIGEEIRVINESLTIVEGSAGPGGELNRGYLVGEEEFAIIDAGKKGTLENIFEQAVYNKGKTTKDLKYIFLTHLHPDNAGGIYRLKKIFPNAQVVVNKKSEDLVKDPSRVLKNKHFNFSKKERLFFAIKKDPFEDLMKFKPDILFDDGDKFEVGSTKIMTINFDSHCEGHTMYFSTLEKAMFTGDALNIYPALPHSYLIDLSGSYKEWLRNIEFLQKAKISYLCPAHDQYQEGRHIVPYVEDVVRAFNQYERQIEMAMSEQKYLTVEELSERVNNAQGIIWYGAYQILAPKVNMIAHLNKLIDEGKVKKNEQYKPVTYTWIK
ncbi:MAG: MBL fold metallo-hydrolase [Candidatus Heimdallarchaeaceae archaeon]